MLATVELAAALRHAAVARAAYEALLPYAELPVMASLLAVVCFGSTHRLLGVAASTCGEHDRAVEHLAAAVTANERLGHRPAALQAQAELGLALVEPGAAMMPVAVTRSLTRPLGRLRRSAWECWPGGGVGH